VDLPVIDIGALVAESDPADRQAVADRMGAACRDTGFFYVSHHGVAAGLQLRLEELSREFFALPVERKSAIRMELAGAAWRGWFPVGAELTSGRTDVKEGIYFGSELGPEHPRVLAGIPLHGSNLMPDQPPELGPTVLAWIDAMTGLAHALMRGLALSLELPETWFAEHWTTDPTVLFRIFNYPPAPVVEDGQWGVGEHTDYGLLTILKQDHHGGLQVRARAGGWIEAPPVPDTFVCNIGDMLDRLTGGHYRSTPHRVVPSVGHHRLSWPFFLDPSWDADVRPVGRAELAPDARTTRWDGADLHEYSGTYGEYLLTKVGKVFPALRNQVR
jgi:isopenicillin N synthase-like dioxygenase